MASLYTHAATNATDLLSKTSLPSDIYSGIDFSSLSLRAFHTGLILHVDAELDRSDSRTILGKVVHYDWGSSFGHWLDELSPA